MKGKADEDFFGSRAETEIFYNLESFGKYLEELYCQGRKTELDGLVISRRLSLVEATLLAERSPLLEHIRSYEEDET